MMGDVAKLFRDQDRRIADLERRARWRTRTGRVHAVDARKGRARVDLGGGTETKPNLTPWLPWEELAAGSNRTHMPLSVGQQVRIVSESGDIADATIQASINSDRYARPSQAADEYVLAHVGPASVRILSGGAEIELRVGSSVLSLTAAGLTHNGKNIGHDHTHQDVTPGGGNTGGPN